MRISLNIFLLIFVISFSGNSIAQKQAPVQLLQLSTGNDSTITLNADVVKNLFLNPKLKDRQVVVFSIVGAFRKGKSFLLNYLLRYLYAHYPSLTNTELINEGDDWMGEPEEPLTGFEWKSGVARVTKGLILWGDVFLHDGPRNEKYAIYIMDTQGLFDTDTTTAENSKIFSLSTLISSIQILNIFNILQEDQLQYLQFATEYARFGSSVMDSDKTPFQDLLVLIRDWNGVDEFKYGLRGGNAYLNRFLEIQDYQSKELQSVRRYIKSSFKNINCFLMPYPGKTVAVDKRYDGRWISIDEDYVTMMTELFNHLFKELKPKLINGKAIKPDELLVFINTYVENFKNDSMPKALSIYESTMDKQFSILMAKSVDLYVESVSSFDGEITSELDINKLHATAKDKALKYFNSEKKFGSISDGFNHKKELTKKIDENFKQWKAVTLSQLRKLQAQKSVRLQQEKLIEDAQEQDEEAKKQAREAAAELEEAQRALASIKSDNQAARREVEQLKARIREAQDLRNQAAQQEIRTNERLQKLQRDKDFYEQEYNKLKGESAQDIGRELNKFKSEDGILGIINVGKVFYEQFKGIFDLIMMWFGAADED
ncbi:atlastin-like [Chironomus tepperi]|uniref:atlastin-like n=1 Tax=Chironomus tepperi TaxID=113505 RepID=UPI00391F4563